MIGRSNRISSGNSHIVTTVAVTVLVLAGQDLPAVAALVVLAIGQGLYGLAMGMSNSHEMSYRQLVTPDELQAGIYKNEIAPNIRDGAAIAFAHGLNVHFGLIEPKKTAPKRVETKIPDEAKDPRGRTPTGRSNGGPRPHTIEPARILADPGAGEAPGDLAAEA